MFQRFKYLVLLSMPLCLLSWTGCSSNEEGHANLPQKLGDLSLSRVLGKEEATKVIDRMHGKKLGISDNYIAHYGHGDLNNTLYVSVYQTTEQAKQALMEMAMKMAGGTSVFSPLTSIGMGDKAHFQTEGMGRTHYFYRVDNTLIWWQVEPEKAEATYADLLRFKF